MFTIHLDDIPVFVRGIREHNTKLRLDSESHLRLVDSPAPKKCLLLRHPVNGLRCTVLIDGIALTKIRTKQVSAWLTPTTHTELRGFVDLSGCCRRWIERFAKIERFLPQLMEKQVME
ncbi:Retrovirus-related Pol polyprotein [Echinococcus granulosus]|uniref:Retrovirus-related Pol polyprotein n=1 Tax=Echinococcus granulosus TaxID=6210 RepID=W6UNW7_ECHGR|nr:Retrovirus-related Pol polyprotein [Echinococcus granulosus]EUB55084.1 Retrovirus-related Pol polyprotein [Echinococcus granulosus]